jgi:hypothetical protein
MSLNYFNVASVTTDVDATSTIDQADLVTAIQNKGVDDYFDTTNELGKVYIYYTHEDGRQQKKLRHDSVTHQAVVNWSEFARDGTWEKTQVKAFDHDGATTFLYRSDIGSAEDLTHSDGTTTLNTA